MVPGTVESKARKIVWKRFGLVIVTHYSFSFVSLLILAGRLMGVVSSFSCSWAACLGTGGTS